MRPIWRNTSTAALTLAVAGAATLGLASPALAAPGDASATGVVAQLSAEVLGVPVVSANATIGSVTAPPGGGTDSDTGVAVSLPGATGAAASGTLSLAASRNPGISTASSTIEDFSLSILGASVVTADEISASVSCPAVGTQVADTVQNGLTLFGAPVNLLPNTPGVDGSVAIVVPGLVGGALNVTLTSVETVVATGATATAVIASATITGTVSGLPVNIDVGDVTIASATCERALAPAAPIASSINPNAGPESGGQLVTITGSNFVPGGTTVVFDGVPGTNVTVAPGGTSLTVVTPAGEVGPASVVVSTASGDSDSLGYTYLADGSDAVVTDLTPTTGPTAGGTLVTITGTGFTGATGVTFDGVPGTSFTVNPAGTTITVVTPANAAGPATVNLVFPAGTATAPVFTYVAPTITDITPEQGPTSGGTSVTITGTGFTGATGVTFGGNLGTNLVVNAAGTSLTVTTPPGPVGPVDVVVLLPGPDATAPDGFTYVLAAPTISDLDPDQGPTAGGTTVTVDGSGFVPGETIVNICGRSIPATSVTVSPDGLSLTFVTPPCGAGNTTVTVTTTEGSSSGLTFRYVNGGLPVTGAPASTLFVLALVLIGAGAVALVLIRRRARLSFTI
ncbi:IPT/TIG domain-containing protein [Micromonospora pisi]|uniref:IPT/TIG domain-containing protein n=1 Tax=Micromonospora pisi TaxID=589240 RepID=A0A495JQ32_9ACTN|nr:IPT/TIG domain-containing protein [Micromonospora pisi]RKR90482.1 IPT/TIG domain-containing protein [Micromonospora pisi]